MRTVVTSSNKSSRPKRSGGEKNSSDEALFALVDQVQKSMKQDLLLKEVHIPNARAEARCNIYVSPNYAQCEKIVLFVQPGKGAYMLRPKRREERERETDES